jgi:periplasmic mercuric ion binding protein
MIRQIGREFCNFISNYYQMKKIIIATALLAGFATAGFSQTKPVLTAIIKTPNALCELCKDRIETYLKRYDGVIEVTVNFRKGETKVKYVTDRINIEEIKTAIANDGYDADDVPANEDSYNRLPKTCKKFEDGGGHPKPKTPPPPPAQQ